MIASPTLWKEATDRDLVATATTGVEGSFEELVRRYQRPISAYVYRMVGDYETALELTQEIFIKVYGSLAKLPSGRLRHRTASSKATQRIRKSDWPLFAH